MTQSLKTWQTTSYLSGNNAEYIEGLYETYLKDPNSVDARWRDFFASLAKTDVSHADVRAYFAAQAKQKTAAPVLVTGNHDVLLERKQSQVTQLVNAYRIYGHRKALLDPLELTPRTPVDALELKYHGLSEADLNTQFAAGTLNGLGEAKLNDIIAALNETYCRTIGTEYMHISDANIVRWIQQRLESTHANAKCTPDAKKKLLTSLTAAEGIEKYLGAKYVGQKRFGVEGGESFIPLLENVIHSGAQQGSKEIVIAMAHRGRLNVLVNLLGKPLSELFDEFEGKKQETLRSGDVKYHLGFSSDIATQAGPVHLVLAFNPSHLEIVGPVVEGSVRARQDRRQDTERDQVLPIIVHGDSAFIGQGVVMETFTLSQLRHFTTGGTVHIVINNQVGFTTSDPQDTRSTLYCTDIAKMVEAPIFHVNGDDPEAVLFVSQLAIDFRMKFKRDVVVDLVCYRRFGHNEADEPSATQPLMYKKIRAQIPVRKLYADQLIKEQICTAAEADSMVKQYRDALDQGQTGVKIVPNPEQAKYTPDWTPYFHQSWTASANTQVTLPTLQVIAKKLETLPTTLKLQTQVGKMMESRRQMTAGAVPVNWGYAETLSYASLLEQGYPIRLCGQDSSRGTFAHRHGVLYSQETGETYIPLQHLSSQQARFEVIDSPLSEAGVMAFEYGYATANPKPLVVWEAQYGDFANNAQGVIDQFISSGDQKWGRLCGLVLLLPHGFEGGGPEHSSSRLERYLQLCAQENMQICVPSTPAQIFHLLRRQVIRPYRKPLIVLTPKSLLRHELAVSRLTDLSEGEFQLVIREMDEIKSGRTQRVVLCCGKVYYDLLEKRRAEKRVDVALIRIEQLYPFPKEALTKVLAAYKSTKEVVWCQEEPKNQGAWFPIQHHLLECLAAGQTLTYVGRPASASPASGYHGVHVAQQTTLVNEALKIS